MTWSHDLSYIDMTQSPSGLAQNLRLISTTTPPAKTGKQNAQRKSGSDCPETNGMVLKGNIALKTSTCTMLESDTLYDIRKRHLVPCQKTVPCTMLKDVTQCYAGGQPCIMLEGVSLTKELKGVSPIRVLKGIGLAKVLKGVGLAIYRQMTALP